MITKEQAIEILEKALANPNYLADRHTNDNSTNWFCSSIVQVVEGDYQTKDELSGYIQNTYVYPSINESLFLISYLLINNKITTDIKYSDVEYKIAARNHWATLIEKLKGEIQYDATLYIPGTSFEMKGKVSNIVHD